MAFLHLCSIWLVFSTVTKERFTLFTQAQQQCSTKVVCSWITHLRMNISVFWSVSIFGWPHTPKMLLGEWAECRDAALSHLKTKSFIIHVHLVSDCKTLVSPEMRRKWPSHSVHLSIFCYLSGKPNQNQKNQGAEVSQQTLCNWTHHQAFICVIICGHMFVDREETGASGEIRQRHPTTLRMRESNAESSCKNITKSQHNRQKQEHNTVAGFFRLGTLSMKGTAI